MCPMSTMTLTPLRQGVCVCACGRGGGGGAGQASGSRQQRSLPTAGAIYLCLGPPGRSDTNGITLTVGQRVGAREKRVCLWNRRRRRRTSGGTRGRETESCGEKVHLRRIYLLEAGEGGETKSWERKNRYERSRGAKVMRRAKGEERGRSSRLGCADSEGVA